MSNIFVTSDYHLFHQKSIFYGNRPFKNAAEMANGIVKNANSLITADDELYILGDLAFAGHSDMSKLRSIVERINGTKHLIIGNHDDLRPRAYLAAGFQTVHTSFHIDLEDGTHAIMIHDPAEAYRLSPEPGTLIICGHVHAAWRWLPESNWFNVGIDVSAYHPVGINSIPHLIDLHENPKY